MRFDISHVPIGAVITTAILNVYYFACAGDNVDNAAPDSTRVGHVVVDHMDDWGTTIITTFGSASKAANIGTLVPDDVAHGGGQWRQLNVITEVQTDVDEQGTPNNSCYRLRQSLEQAYGTYPGTNFWGFRNCGSGTNPPFLTIFWEGGPSSSSSFSSSSGSPSSSSSSSCSSLSWPSGFSH